MKIKYKVDYPNKTVYASGRTINGLVYESKAKCSPNDTFDVSIGKKIARLRIELKQIQNIKYVANKKMEQTLDILEQQNNRVGKLNKRLAEVLQNLSQIEG